MLQSYHKAGDGEEADCFTLMVFCCRVVVCVKCLFLTLPRIGLWSVISVILTCFKMVGVFYMVLQRVKVLSGVSCLFGQILNRHSIFISHVIIVIVNLQRFVQSQDMHNQQVNSYLLYLLV